MPIKRIPSGFSSKAIKDGDWSVPDYVINLSETKLHQKRDSSTKVLKMTSKQNKQVDNVRSDDPTVLLGGVSEFAVKFTKAKKGREDLIRMDSSAPTALIAPDDYKHIFKGKTLIKAKQSKEHSLAMASDAPTALIAPNDYEHIFKGKELINAKKVEQSLAVPSDAPTALIAPDDYEHIYAGKRVKSKSPGSKGLEGKVLSITNDNVLVAFDNGQKLSVPLNHVNLV